MKNTNNICRSNINVVEDEKLQPLFLEVWNLKLDFGSVKFVAVPRQKNRRADQLVNQVLDQQGSRLF